MAKKTKKTNWREVVEYLFPDTDQELLDELSILDHASDDDEFIVDAQGQIQKDIKTLKGEH